MEVTKQTATQWLFDNLKSHFEHDGDLLEAVEMSYQQAKELEKQQIIDAFESGVYDGGENVSQYNMNSEQYYNETFKSE